MHKNNIHVVVEKQECTGCGLCINVCPTKAIEYGEDKYKFSIPLVIESKCINCELCLKSCPTLKINNKSCIKVYAATSKNLELKKQCSSGGIFGSIAEYLIKDNWIVYGCTMTDDFVVKHIRINRLEDLHKVLRSKYVQSNLGFIYRNLVDDLKNGKKVLFSGTPCQVAAVNNLVPDYLKQNLLTIDVVCHGVPSQEFFNSYLKDLLQKRGKVESYFFRAKRQSDNGMSCFFSYKIKNSKKFHIRNWPEDTYNYLYMMSYIYRDSCYKCQYAKSTRPGDITLCDYWGWNKYHDEFNIGTSVSAVLINSLYADNVFEKVKENYLIAVPTKLSNVIAHNGCLVKPSICPSQRNQILDMWLEKGFVFLDKIYKRKTVVKRLKYKLMRIIPQSLLNHLLFYKSKYK